MSGEAHRAGREGRTRLEIHAQKVEATRHAADEGLLRVLLQPEVGEHLIHHPHGAAQVPAGLGQDHPIIHEAGVADAGECGHGVIQGGEVERPHQGGERGAEGDALGDGVEIAVLHEGAATVLADEVEEGRIVAMRPEEFQQAGVLDVGVVALGIGAGHIGVVPGQQGLADGVDGTLHAAPALEVVAVPGEMRQQQRLEALGHQLEDEGVLRLPTFQPLPCGGEHPGHGREAVARPAGPEVGEQPGFPRVPVPAEVPHGMVGVAGLAALAQPLESALHQRRPRPRRPAARGGRSGGECGAVGHGWEVVGQAVAKLAVRRARWRVGSTTARMAASFSGTPRKAASGGSASSGRCTRSA